MSIGGKLARVEGISNHRLFARERPPVLRCELHVRRNPQYASQLRNRTNLFGGLVDVNDPTTRATRVTQLSHTVCNYTHILEKKSQQQSQVECIQNKHRV